ncbi:MAG: hypothetical protein AB2A00_12780 [Myxococcota bacterium]
MGRVLAFLVGVGAVLAGLIFFFGSMDSQIKRLKFENERYALKQRFAAKIPHLQSVEDEKAAFDLQTAVKEYAKSLAELYKKYPEFRDPDSILKRWEKDYQDKKVDEGKIRGARERVTLVKGLWEKFLTDNYKPVMTSADKSLRVDIYNVEKKAVDGQDKLIVHVAYIGGTPDKSMGFGGIEMQIPLADDDATAKKRAKGELKDNKQERKATVSGGGEPNTLILEPEKWVEDFPPGIVIGYYDFPLFPAEAKSMELTMDFEFKNPGGGRVANAVKFKPMELKPEWKLPEGSSFEADEQTEE